MARRGVLLVICVSLAASAAIAMELHQRTIVPDRRIVVTDDTGHPLRDFDLYVFRCVYPGSRVDRVIPFPRQDRSEVQLYKSAETAESHPGYVQVAPDFFISREPEAHWVACVDKPGFKSRRWSMDERQGDPLKISLMPGDEAGPDRCMPADQECNPCRSYEYRMYKDMRFSACRNR